MVCACLAKRRLTKFAPGGSSNGWHSSQAERPCNQREIGHQRSNLRLRKRERRKGLAEPTWDTFGQGAIRYGIFVPLAK